MMPTTPKELYRALKNPKKTLETLKNAKEPWGNLKSPIPIDTQGTLRSPKEL